MSNGVCDESCLGLGEDPVPKQTVANCFKIIGSNPITYNNSFPIFNWELLSQSQVNYV